MTSWTSAELVLFWDKSLDWEKRLTGEQDFFAKQLHSYHAGKIFDACAGSGFDSIQFAKASFAVTSNEIDPNFRAEAEENAKKFNLSLNFTPGYDWRSIPDEIQRQFDAVVCLGNSLTYLLDHKDQQCALENFYRLLHGDGPLIIDHRNYNYMLREEEHILENPLQNFRYSRRFYYCGNEVVGYPIAITPSEIVMEYHELSTGKKEHLILYPFRLEEMIDLLHQAGFSRVHTYGDFQETYDAERVDFFQHVALK